MLMSRVLCSTRYGERKWEEVSDIFQGGGERLNTHTLYVCMYVCVGVNVIGYVSSL